ncbi:MAG: hypothetical protein EA426_03100 [Spirochaetaceae bacterium]|nr:MAG: hypothetical protein EA426_03100 [Spirochaetaceae bacterium]
MYMGQLVVARNVWGDEDKKNVEKTILEAIKQDPLVVDKTNVSVTFGDSRKKELHLIGKLGDEKQRERVREIAGKNTPTDVEIHDEIVVG